MPIITEKPTDLTVTELGHLLHAELAPGLEEHKSIRLLALADKILHAQTSLDTPG